MMVKPACVKCGLFLTPEFNGCPMLECMPIGNVGAGKENAKGWEPYKLWIGDLWKCRGCGFELVVGIIGGPFAEHYEPQFQGRMQFAESKSAGRCRELVKIYDC